jgi:2',3'-cyclic-nucleotide 2'-phosphodiesterase
MKIFFIGDIFARPGRTIVRELLRPMVQERGIDLVIANGENAAAGFGITPSLVDELLELGIDVITSGNHIWDKREIIDYFNLGNGNPESRVRRLLRPANYPAGSPGYGLFQGVTRAGVPFAVLNLQGRVFMTNIDDPFRVAEELLQQVQAKVIVVDMHAEATSEKVALGWYLDGRVTAMLGTHTHIPTADERVLPKGTAYQTDVGMTGPWDSVIGVDKEMIVKRFLNSLPARFEAATGDVRLCGTIVECDPLSGRALGIERVLICQDTPVPEPNESI